MLDLRGTAELWLVATAWERCQPIAVDFNASDESDSASDHAGL